MEVKNIMMRIYESSFINKSWSTRLAKWLEERQGFTPVETTDELFEGQYVHLKRDKNEVYIDTKFNTVTFDCDSSVLPEDIVKEYNVYCHINCIQTTLIEKYSC